MCIQIAYILHMCVWYSFYDQYNNLSGAYCSGEILEKSQIYLLALELKITGSFQLMDGSSFSDNNG